MTDHIVNDTIAFHTSDTMLDMHADSRNAFVFRFFFGGQSAFWWFLLWLYDCYSWQGKALECTILCQLAAFRQLILRFVCNPFVMRFPFIGGTQEANMTGLIDHEEVFDRMALLLAAVVVLLVLGIGWAVDRSLRTIMPKRGEKETSSVRLAASITANSSAFRAGSNS